MSSGSQSMEASEPKKTGGASQTKQEASVDYPGGVPLQDKTRVQSVSQSTKEIANHNDFSKIEPARIGGMSSGEDLPLPPASIRSITVSPVSRAISPAATLPKLPLYQSPIPITLCAYEGDEPRPGGNNLKISTTINGNTSVAVNSDKASASSIIPISVVRVAPQATAAHTRRPSAASDTQSSSSTIGLPHGYKVLSASTPASTITGQGLLWNPQLF